jgi:hypothetical protein
MRSTLAIDTELVATTWLGYSEQRMYVGAGYCRQMHESSTIGTVLVLAHHHCMQPEICSNIGNAPIDLYHRVQEARKCLLHSLCVMPLWIPSITVKAPVAVLEILQPDTQPDFETLHILVRFLGTPRACRRNYSTKAMYDYCRRAGSVPARSWALSMSALRTMRPDLLIDIFLLGGPRGPCVSQ